MLHHLADVFRQAVNDLLEGNDKRVFVAVAEGAVVHDMLQESLMAGILHMLCNVRMLQVERHQPVRHVVEERVALHL